MAVSACSGFFFLFCMKTEKSGGKKKKEHLRIPPSLKPTFTVRSGKKKQKINNIYCDINSRYKEETQIRTDEKEPRRTWSLLAELAPRRCQTVQPNFASRLASPPSPTLLSRISRPVFGPSRFETQLKFLWPQS